MLMQELFSKQKGFLEEELDYRKQALDQAYMVRSLHWSDLLYLTEFTLENILKKYCCLLYNFKGCFNCSIK